MKSLTVLIKPASSLCNMRCKYCFYHDVADNRKIYSFGLMTEAVMRCLIDEVFNSVDKAGFINFFFQGGEPTLSGLDYFISFIEYVNYKRKQKPVNIQYSLQTNGILIDEAFARFFYKNKFLVGLSLDGMKELHDLNRKDASGNGTFSSVKKAAELLAEKKVEFNILTVITEQSSHKGYSVYNYFKKNKFNYIQFIPQINPFKDNESHKSQALSVDGYARFLKDTFDLWYRDFSIGNYISIRDFDNFAGILMGKKPELCTLQGQCSCNIVIEANGNVYPCDFYVLDEYLLGNINEMTINDMLNGSSAKKFVSDSQINLIDDCKSCKWLSLCRTGCRRYKEPLHETYGKNFFCNTYKEFFNYSIDRLITIPEILREKYK
ncbi:MAG: anaerobic sulfatase maturase [Clostridia bacterium]|nr:anaerobic sulfatase maturase [Clostridia bacterium]